MKRSKQLYIFTATYPFGLGEEFVSKELNELSKYYEKIIVVPQANPNNVSRWMPQNAELNLCLIEAGKNGKFKFLLFSPFLYLRILFTELFYSGKASFILKNIRNFSYTISIAIKWSKLFGHINSANKSDFYSVWNDDAALLLSILRSKNKIQNFSIRLHGYDLFDERRSGGYMPYRYFIFKMAKHIFVLSKAGYSYIRQKKVFEEKLILNYSGIYDRGINPAVEEGKITMVSCSNLIPIKRVHKIVEALSLLEFQVDWYHFGEGPERANIENEIVNLPKHIHAKLMGHIENDKLLEFYSRVPIQLFIHLSETEGLGMALVEAQSFGIPVLACDVGGVSEVVDNELGILIPVDSDARSISNEISLFIASNRGNQVFRDKVRKKCLETFGAEHNYKYFYTMLSSEKS